MVVCGAVDWSCQFISCANCFASFMLACFFARRVFFVEYAGKDVYTSVLRTAASNVDYYCIECGLVG